MRLRKAPSSQGAVLVGLVAVITLLGFVGATVVTLTITSAQTRVLAGEAMRTRLLAESGIAYAKSVIRADFEASPSGTYILEGGDRFTLATTRNGRQVQVRSTGIVNAGLALENQRSLTAVFQAPLNPEVLPVGFDFDDDGEFDEEDWNVQGLGDPVMRNTGPSGNQQAMGVTGTEGTITLNWQDRSELDLQPTWQNNGNLLSYQLQLKVLPFDTGNQQAYSHHYLLGLIFRFREDPVAHYGLSFFHSRLTDDNGQPETPPAWFPPELEALRGRAVHVILWYRNGETFELLAQRELTAEDGLLLQEGAEDALADYSTLLLDLREDFSGPGGARRNTLSAYLAGTAQYPLWSNLNDMRWSDDSEIFGPALTWDQPSGQQELIDDRLVSDNFATRPDEVGLQVLFDQSGGNKKFFADFALLVSGFSNADATPDHIQF